MRDERLVGQLTKFLMQYMDSRGEEAPITIGDFMAYTVISERDNRWQPRKGLEGPFYFATGRVLYYDVQEGAYWDPLTDFFVPNDEVALLHAELTRMLSR